jgi:hypothetical protein
MANQILFISESKVKSNSDIMDNVEPEYIANAILKMQRAKVLPVIGSDIYNKLCNLIELGTIGATGNEIYYNMVIDYIQSSVIEFVSAEVMLSNTYKITTKGVLQFENENSSTIDLKTLQYLVKRYEDQGEYWLTRLRDYCLEFSKLGQLPEYLNPTVNDDRTIEPDKRSPYRSTIYLKGYYTPNSNYDEREYWRRQDNAPYGA